MLMDLHVAGPGQIVEAEVLDRAEAVLEEPQDPVRAAAPQRAAHEPELDVDEIAVGRLPLDRSRDLGPKRRREAFVTGEGVCPVVVEVEVLEGPVLLLRAVARVVELNDLGACLTCDLDRSIGAVRVDDDHLVSPIDAPESVADVRLLVEHGENHRERNLGPDRGARTFVDPELGHRLDPVPRTAVRAGRGAPRRPVRVRATASKYMLSSPSAALCHEYLSATRRRPFSPSRLARGR